MANRQVVQEPEAQRRGYIAQERAQSLRSATRRFLYTDMLAKEEIGVWTRVNGLADNKHKHQFSQGLDLKVG